MSEEDNITQSYMAPRAAVRRLMEEQVVHGLDDPTLDRLRAECWDGNEDQMEDAGLLGILTSFYEGVDRGMKDGFLWHGEPFWHETEDAVAELNTILRIDPPLYRQVSARKKVSVARKFREDVLHLVLEREGGGHRELEARSLDDLVDCFNDELKARGARRRLLPLETGDEWKMYVALDLPLARALTLQGALPLAGLEALDG